MWLKRFFFFFFVQVRCTLSSTGETTVRTGWCQNAIQSSPDNHRLDQNPIPAAYLLLGCWNTCLDLPHVLHPSLDHPSHTQDHSKPPHENLRDPELRSGRVVVFRSVHQFRRKRVIQGSWQCRWWNPWWWHGLWRSMCWWREGWCCSQWLLSMEHGAKTYHHETYN